MMAQEFNIPRLMIAAPGSGSGKTTVTCGLLQAFVNRGVNVVSFKCGPDYIDPMFHTEVLGLKSRNLDLFFTDEDATRALLCKNAAESELAVIEGVMGYYDGLAGISTAASSYELARTTKTPAVLLIDCKGKSVSILPEIKGFLEFRKDSGVCGVILNRLPAALYPDLAKLIEREVGIKVYGYVPALQECSLESRHLGLVTAKEVGNLREILQKLAAQMDKTVEISGLLELAAQAPELSCEGDIRQSGETGNAAGQEAAEEAVRIGVAMDKAFCFYYQDNLELLEELGAEIVPFSPLEDRGLPEGLCGLIFGGGYPELYLDELEQNVRMMRDIREALRENMPCLAECGGFMYLHQWVEDRSGNRFPMVGAVEGGSYPTERLGRFGYISLTSQQDSVLGSAGLTLKGHEFHYWDSTDTGDAFQAQKPLRKTGWSCMVAKGNLLAGYPHIHYCSNPAAAENFIRECRKFRK